MSNSKFAPRVCSAESLANFAAEQWPDGGSFTEVLDDDGCIRDDVKGMWFVTQWPDHCVTEQHLGDATIHGPFATEAEAAEACR